MKNEAVREILGGLENDVTIRYFNDQQDPYRPRYHLSTPIGVWQMGKILG